jgi:hypothetical protein
MKKSASHISSQSIKRSLLAPIFLFSNWRTGGTALILTFRKHDNCYIYTEPLNPTLRSADVALAATTSSWKSKHPQNEYYFTEYEPILSDDSFRFPDVEKIPYILEADDSQEDLLKYFTSLISYAHSINKIPVFKLEQAEGSADWIKANFPDALCVGVTRKAEYQFISWLEQTTFGNNLFFGLAHRIIENNLEFFESEPIALNGRYDTDVYKKIFDIFKRKIDFQHSLYMDFCVDISPESEESLHDQLAKVEEHDFGRFELWKYVLSRIHDSLIRESDSDITIKRLINHIGDLAESSLIQDRLNNTINDYQRTVSDQIVKINELNQRVNELNQQIEAAPLMRIRKLLRRQISERRK